MKKTILELWSDFFESQIKNLDKAKKLVVKTLKRGNKILVAGNGGSASQASHLAAEIMGKFQKGLKPYPAISLSSDTSIITSLSNDFGYENLFLNQVKGLGGENDLFIGISTSGASKNIINSAKISRQMNMKVLTLTGNKKSDLENLSDIIIKVPSESTPRIQEIHLYILHNLAQAVDESLR